MIRKISNLFIYLTLIINSSFVSFATQNTTDDRATVNASANTLSDPSLSFGDGSGVAKKMAELLTNNNNSGIMDLASLAGYVILALGIGQMIFAFKDDNADAKSKASMVMMGGVFLIVIKVILTNMGII